MSALEELVRQAMGSGAACFVERYARGELDLATSMTDALGDFPADWIAIRTDLIADLRREWLEDDDVLRILASRIRSGEAQVAAGTLTDLDDLIGGDS